MLDPGPTDFLSRPACCNLGHTVLALEPPYFYHGQAALDPGRDPLAMVQFTHDPVTMVLAPDPQTLGTAPLIQTLGHPALTLIPLPLCLRPLITALGISAWPLDQHARALHTLPLPWAP